LIEEYSVGAVQKLVRDIIVVIVRWRCWVVAIICSAWKKKHKQQQILLC